MLVRNELNRLIVASLYEGFVYANSTQEIKDFVFLSSMANELFTWSEEVCWISNKLKGRKLSSIRRLICKEFREMETFMGSAASQND